MVSTKLKMKGIGADICEMCCCRVGKYIMCTILTDRVAIAAGMVKKLDQVVAGDNAGGDDIREGGHLGGRRGGRGGESKK